ncbi:MAG: HPr family phosphocarrier protein [Clostridium sp.]
MKEINYVIKDELGIHARPAGLLVKEASKFDSDILIKTKGKEADAKKILRVMGLVVKQGDEVIVTCDGSDEAAAIEAMNHFFTHTL